MIMKIGFQIQWNSGKWDFFWQDNSLYFHALEGTVDWDQTTELHYENSWHSIFSYDHDIRRRRRYGTTTVYLSQRQNLQIYKSCSVFSLFFSPVIIMKFTWKFAFQNTEQPTTPPKKNIAVFSFTAINFLYHTIPDSNHSNRNGIVYI